MNYSGERLLLSIIGLVLAAVFIAIWDGYDKTVSAANACEAAGGVQVKQYPGYACIKAERVKP